MILNIYAAATRREKMIIIKLLTLAFLSTPSSPKILTSFIFHHQNIITFAFKKKFNQKCKFAATRREKNNHNRLSTLAFLSSLISPNILTSSIFHHQNTITFADFQDFNKKLKFAATRGKK